MKKISIITHLITVQFIFASLFISQSFFIDIKGETEIKTHISTDAIWDKNGSPYIIKTDTIITEGNTLTIEAGVEIKFEIDASLVVNGNIQVLGTPNNPVIFTSNMGLPYIGNWEGITLKNSSNRLEYFHILYSGHGLGLEESSNNFISNGSIDHVKFNGITLTMSDRNHISNVTLYVINEPWNTGIYLDGSSYNEIVDCTVYNGSYGIYLDYGRNNNVSRCSTPGCSGGIEVFQTIDCVVEHCDVSNTVNGINIDADYTDISNNRCDSNLFLGIELRGTGNRLRDNQISNCENWSFRFDGNDIEDYFNDIDTSNTINGKPMYIFQNEQNLTINSSFDDFGYLGFISCSNITVSGINDSGQMHDIIFVDISESIIQDNNFSNNYFGLLFVSSYNNIIRNNYFLNTSYGISLQRSSDNVLNRNSIIDSKEVGIHLDISNNNYVTENNIRNTHRAFAIILSSDNIFHHNNIINCTNIFEPDSWASQAENLWNDPTDLGNYWDNYQGQDTNNDGIGDTEIPHEEVDYYPLMNYHVCIATPHTPPEINDMWFSTNETYFYVDFYTYVHISDFEIDSEYLILTRFYVDDELLDQIPEIKYERERIWNITWNFPDNAHHQLGPHRIGVIFKDPTGYQSKIYNKEIKLIETPYNFVEFEIEKSVYYRGEKLKVSVNATEYSSDYCPEENLNLSVSVNYILFSIFPQTQHIWHWPDLPDTQPEIIEDNFYNYTSKKWETVFNLTRTMGVGNYSIGCYINPFQWREGDYRYKKFIIAPFNITILNNNPEIISLPDKFVVNKERLEVNLTPYMYDAEGLYVMVREYNESDAMSSWIYNFRGEWIESNMKSLVWEVDLSSVNKSLFTVNITDINNNTLTIIPVDNKIGYDEIILNVPPPEGGGV